jgi:deazaflavin-dependent oxidoreductase (nitroreductase family)
MSNWNEQLIELFRSNDGNVETMFPDAPPLLLLHHTGAKTGTQRIAPLAFQELDGSWAIFASKGGAPDNPDWYHNLLAHPQVEVEFATQTLPVTARVAADEERTPIWTKQKIDRPGFAEYEAKTDRQIPVIILDPR